MLTPEDLSYLLRDLATSLLDASARDASEAATMDGVALLKNRVQTKGEDADGNPFTAYSTKDVPLFFYKNKSRSGSDTAVKRLEANAAPSKTASYSDWRVANNLRVDIKDFTFTGRMMTNIRIINSQFSPGYIFREVGPAGDEEKKKMENLTKQQGEIMAWNKDETDHVGEAFKNELIERLKEALQ